MRIALGLEYCGAAFKGWQRQKGGGTVQDALEGALAEIAGHPVSAVCAGRTDAGVHAANQVAHFDTAAPRPLTAWVRGVNSHLPAGVAVRWAAVVDESFHARFSARGRRYRYLLLHRAQRPGLWQGRAGWFHRPLDVFAMQEAAGLLLGEHDFSAFRAAGCQARTPVKTLWRADVRQAGPWLIFDFEASAFLHHMVRNLVGSLVYVGQGKHPPQWIGQLLAQKDRRRAAPTFSPDGLYFQGPIYDPRWALPEAEDALWPGLA